MTWSDVPPASVGCYTIVALELIVIPLPDMPDATFQDPFIICDESGNGQAIFDLTLQDLSVLGIQDPTAFVLPITYYEDPLDADAGINWIDPANAFLSGGQTIWVRLESLLTGCARVTQFEIEVGLFPTIGTGDDLFLCDDQINGSTLDDGLSTFDLTVNTPLITLGDPTLSVFYYATAADQSNGIPIATPEAYQNSITPQQEIFVNGFSVQGCIATSSFFIHVDPNPVAVSPDPLIACDDNNDGFAEFDLSLATNAITLGDLTLTVTYHGTFLDAPYKELCGCGVGFKLIQALSEKRGLILDDLLLYLDLVATAIGADIVPITGENRILAYYGLKVINSNPRYGFKAILKQVKKETLTITDVVFIIAPRINAAGRMKHGNHAVTLLTETDIHAASEFASEIEQFNIDRKEADKRITEEALEQITTNNEEGRMTTVVYKEDWHKGVIGIVASRLTETYYRPTLVFTKSGDKLAASARSVKGFDVYNALEGCAEYIEQFGGHMYAAGLTLFEKDFVF